MIKKQISLLLSLLLILLPVASIAYAKDDAAGLRYNAEIAVYGSNNEPTSVVQCGDTIRVDILLNSTGVATAPLYAIQGKLSYGSNYLLYKDSKSPENIQTSVGNDVISFSFLDKKLGGKNVSYPYQLVSITFVALQDATTQLMFSQFDVTNSDSSERNVDYSSLKEIKIGTGVRTEDKPALLRLIDVCKNELDKVIVSANADDVSMHTFWVNQDTYDRFKLAIKAATEMYENLKAEKEDIANTFKNLDAAIAEFRANKLYGNKIGDTPGGDGDGDGDGGGSHSGGTVTKKTMVTVTAIADGNGKISEESLKQVVAKNTSVTIVSLPDEGYEVDQVYVNGEAFEGSETFTIPKVTNDTVVKVTFRWKNVFSDVKNDDWFYESVMFANKNGLMKGTSDTEFEPESAVTRGMFVTVLYRMEKEPVTDLARFTDVKPDDYFAKAVGWAKENNIVNGATATEFAPNENVTREQMAAIIYRYATQKGIDVTSAKATYADATEISEYATDAIDFCTAKQILQGKGDNVFAPKDDATRAEIAAVFMRMVGKLK